MGFNKVQNVSYPPFAGLLSARECIKVKSELSKMHYNDNAVLLTGRLYALTQREISVTQWEYVWACNRHTRNITA